MPNQKQQYVYLMPQRDEQNVVSWFWLYNGQAGPAATFPVIEANKNSGGHDIYFTIFDPQKDIKFAGHNGPNTSAAIAIAEKQPTLPKPTSGIDSKGEIKNILFNADGTQLFLDNANGKKMTFVYTLNFVDSNGNKVTSIDPELKNGGGGTRLEVYYALGAALIGALLAILVVRYALGWRSQ